MSKRRKPEPNKILPSDLPDAFRQYLGDRDIEEVEIVIPDLAGTSRGKAMLAHKFKPKDSYFLPISLFYQTISGEYVDMNIENQWREMDILLNVF